MTSYHQIGDVHRDAAVERLREHRDAGRLSDSDFQQRVATALDARTQADLDPLFVDLPHEPQPGIYELYPQQSVAPYVAPESQRPREPSDWSARTQALPSSGDAMSIKLGKLEINNIPTWVLVVLAVVAVGILMKWVGWAWWWLFFFGPAIGNAFSKNQKKNRRRGS